MNAVQHPLRKYIRPHVTKTTTCPGCGNGIAAQAILRAIDELGLSLDEFVFVSGIGCSAWIPSPLFAADTLHTTHGRPIPYATGVKLGLPDKHVMVVSGDGDLSAIGGNHLIHAARKNIGLTVVLMNNRIYGMTGGQTAPTTPKGLRTITSPYETLEYPFNIAEMVVAAGAPFVARWTTFHPRQITRSLKKALKKKGFSLIEVITQCPVQFGRVSKLGNAVNMLRHFKETSVTLKKAQGMEPSALEGKIVVGEFVELDKAELSQECARIARKAQEAN